MDASPLQSLGLTDGDRPPTAPGGPAFQPPPDDLLATVRSSPFETLVVKRLTLVGVPDHGHTGPRDLERRHEHRVGHDDGIGIARVIADHARPLHRETSPRLSVGHVNSSRPWGGRTERLSLASAEDGRRHPQTGQALGENPRANLEATVRFDDRAEGYEQRPERTPGMILDGEWRPRGSRRFVI